MYLLQAVSTCMEYKSICYSNFCEISDLKHFPVFSEKHSRWIPFCNKATVPFLQKNVMPVKLS